MIKVLALALFGLGCVFLIIAWVVCAMVKMLDKNMVKGERNYQVRFNPRNKKYFVVNHTSRGDYNVKHYVFFTMHFDDRIEADLIAQRMNNVE